MPDQNNESTNSRPLMSRQDSYSEPINLKEIIFRYIKYVPWIVVCGLIGFVLGYIKIRYSTPIYRAQATMMVNDDGGAQGANSKDPRFQELFMTQGSVNLSNEIQILTSSPFLGRVVRALNLEVSYYNIGKIRSTLMYPYSPFRLRVMSLADSNGEVAIQFTVLNETSFVLGTSKTPINFGQEFSVGGSKFVLETNGIINLKAYSTLDFQVICAPARKMAIGIAGSLKVSETADGSTILQLSYDGENGLLGAAILDKLMAVYDTLFIENKNRVAANTLEFVDNQLNILKGQLGEVEGRTKGYMINNNIFDVSGQSRMYMDNIEESAKKAADQQVKIAVLDMLYDYVGDPKNANKLVPTNLGIEEPVLNQLVLEYNRVQLQKETNLKTTTPNNPLIRDIDVSLEKMRTDILQALRSVRQSYEIVNKNLAQQSNVNQGRLKSIPGQSMQLTNIQRQQKILEDLYSFLLMKKLETGISSASIVSNSRVVEPARDSPDPISPNKKSIFIMYLLAGILIPTGVIVAKELLKDKVSGRADVEKRTHAPILGEIGHSDDKQALVVVRNSRRFIAEQFRIIRSNLKYVTANAEKPVILVTSSFSGEGKSFVSTNIGAALALTGKKTVIMEFDIRKPKIVSGLDLKRKQGITNYIVGKAGLEDLILPVQGLENLYVIPCGPIPPNPAELLLDSKLDDLMQEVVDHFDTVILDTAPIGLVSDAISLAKYASCTLYIVRQGHTFLNQLNLIEDLYIEKKLPSISILLNDVKIEGGYYGGYHGGYGYYGGSSYGNRSGYFDEERLGGKRNDKSGLKGMMKWLFSQKP